MQIYLPIAEISVSIFLLLGMGAGVGFLSGMFGVGGGFLMTPLLIFLGIPPSVAVATEANQIVAASVSGALAHWRRRNVDIKMGLVLLAGGLVGSVIGTQIFTWMKTLGQNDLMIKICYVVFLGIIGGLMFFESARALMRQRAGTTRRRKMRQHYWVHGLPFKMRFKRSKLYISALPPLAVGCLVGILAAIMGVGGGFIMVPAMIYLLGMPTAVVVGTSLFQITFVTAAVTIQHSYYTQTVDVVLALLLLIGAVVGAQFGTRVGLYLKGEQLRFLLAAMVLAVCIKLGFDLVTMPSDLFSLSSDLAGH
ncbi:sulfite exporter TauE/SafE family protein [Minwuia sp.]|uniref:sulfite exporter TauE/SafE family protein n=1 Tax=Minwuia sp. TaxID=2493630 RepID=UPI003A940D55